MRPSGPILFFLILVPASQAMANVGGYYHGGVEHSGSLGGFEPSATDRIRIIHEQLTVRLKPEAADVEVRYVMRNQTDAPVTARFGFPVAESFDHDALKTGEKQPAWHKPRQITGYRISAGDNPAEVRVLKPAKRFRRAGNDWIWEFEEPTPADDIEVEVTPAISYFDNFVGVLGGNEGDEGFYQSRNGRWTVTHRSYQVKASSTLPPEGSIRYDAGNLADKDPNTVWSEGAVGPDIGEWLELRLRVVKPLDRLRITPGFAGNPKLYAANARPKRLRVELNGEHSFNCEIADEPNSQDIPVGNYRKPVRTIKLTILEAWPGSKHQDLCIADFEVVSEIKELPDFHGIE